jgi:polyisoprenoid-binding protein YceI
MKTTLVTMLIFLATSAFAEVYNIDTAASKVQWKAGKKIGSFHDGDIKIKSGTVDTDAKGIIKSAKIVVDMKTITNTDLKDSPEYQKKLLTHLASDDFFKVKDHEEATFTLTSISPKAGSKDEYTVKGNLEMIGSTQPIEFTAKVSNDKKTITGSATVTIERLKWGLKYGSGSIFKTLTADKIINDTFDLTLNLVAKK